MELLKPKKGANSNSNIIFEPLSVNFPNFLNTVYSLKNNEQIIHGKYAFLIGYTCALDSHNGITVHLYNMDVPRDPPVEMTERLPMAEAVRTKSQIILQLTFPLPLEVSQSTDYVKVTLSSKGSGILCADTYTSNPGIDASKMKVAVFMMIQMYRLGQLNFPIAKWHQECDVEHRAYDCIGHSLDKKCCRYCCDLTLFNVTSVGLNHSLQGTSKPLAALDDVTQVHLVPDHDDGGRELLLVVVGHRLGLPLHDALQME